MEINGQIYGLVFAGRGAVDGYTWAELTGIMDNRILVARDPGCTPVLGDYASPDEVPPPSGLTRQISFSALTNTIKSPFGDQSGSVFRV